MQIRSLSKQENGYMESVMQTLKSGETRQFNLSSVNVSSWRTVASRVNKKSGYKKYSIIKSGRLGIMVIKCNPYE